MIDRTDAAAIRTHWQGQIDESLEAGEALLLEMGVGHSVLTQLGALRALERLAAERVDVTAPLLVVGGDGVAWAATLLSSAPVLPTSSNATALAPAITPFYVGADQATYMASLATLPAVSTHTRQHMVTGLPVGMQSLLLPETQLGVAARWSSLPFALVAQAQAVGDAESADVDDQDAWLQWLTLLIVVGLLIVALFI